MTHTAHCHLHLVQAHPVCKLTGIARNLKLLSFFPSLFPEPLDISLRVFLSKARPRKYQHTAAADTDKIRIMLVNLHFITSISGIFKLKIVQLNRLNSS